MVVTSPRIDPHSEVKSSATRLPANVLWTGGWDSTFRVLQLVVGFRQVVQPHYIVDPDRRSLPNEQRAIREIRRRLAGKNPEAAARIRPVRLVARYDIPADPAIAASLERLRRTTVLWTQYDFLTRYAAHAGIEDLELCFQAADHRVVPRLRRWFIRVEDDRGGHWRIDPNRLPMGNDFTMFAPFRFPLVSLDKLQMKAAARALGVLDVMDATWFCFTPRGRKRDQPCGRCPPCVDAIEEGMADRLPRAAILRYHLRRPVRWLRRR